MRLPLTVASFFAVFSGVAAAPLETAVPVPAATASGAPVLPVPVASPAERHKAKRSAAVTQSPSLRPAPAAMADTLPVPIVSYQMSKRILANGLQVVVVEDHAAPVVQTGMWYRFGSLYETPGKTGLAHGLEHMMFRGTPSLSEGGFDDIMAHEGAQTNANTSNDYTHFYMVLPSSRLELAVRIESDRMRNLLLKDGDWQLEKQAVLNEYDGDLGTPTTLLYNDVCKRATPVPLCGLSALGVRADIVRSNAGDLRKYYDQYYWPNDATLVVVGDVKPQQVFAVAQKAFGGIAPRGVVRPPKKAPVLARNARLTERGDTPYAMVDLAYPSVGDLETGAGAAAVLDAVINNPRSPFYERLVVSGLSLGYETSQNSNLYGGIEHVFITVAPGHSPGEAEGAFRGAVNEALRTGFSPELVTAAKRAALVSAISAHDAIDTLGDRVGYTMGVERRNPEIDDTLIASTTTDAVNEFARRTLAVPSVVGTLIPQIPVPGAAGAATAAVSDSFTGRVPSGPIVKAPWIQALLAKPLALNSRIAPTAFTLSNGLRVLVQPVHDNPTVFIEGRVEGSPLLEPHGKEGVREMVSDLLGFGGERYDFQAQHALVDELGADIEYGESFSAHGLARDLPSLLDLLCDGELHPAFADRYVQLVRNQTLAAIETRDRDPDSKASRALALMLYPAQDPDLRRPERAGVQGISVADLRTYLQTAYRPDLTTLTVTGDVEPESVRAHLEETFGQWHRPGPTPDLHLPRIPMPRVRQQHVLASRRLVEITIAQPSIARSSKDFAALNLLNEMLGGGGSFDTRLMHELRERRGLVYSASSALDVGRYRGLLQISLSTQPGRVAQSIALAKAQLHGFLERPPSQAELDRARERLVSGALVAEQSTAVIAGHVSTIGYFHLPPTYYRNLWTTYRKITPHDIFMVAKRRIHPNHLVIVTEGP